MWQSLDAKGICKWSLLPKNMTKAQLVSLNRSLRENWTTEVESRPLFASGAAASFLSWLQESRGTLLGPQVPLVRRKRYNAMKVGFQLFVKLD